MKKAQFSEGWALLLAGVVLLAPGCGGQGRREEAVSNKVTEAVPDTVARKLDLVLARVGDEDITYGDLRAHMMKRTGPTQVDRNLSNPDIMHIALSSLVDQFVWENRARKAGTKLDRDEAMQIRALETQLYATHYVAEEIEPKARATREEVEKYYQEHIESFRVPPRIGARHILVRTQDEAQRLKVQAEAGTDFAALARQHSQDANTRDLGGALGMIEQGKDPVGIRDSGFVQAVLLMEEGEIAVIQSGLGWHVVKAEKKEGGGPQPLEEVYERISQGLLPRNFGRIYNEELAKAREDIGVQYVAENIEKATGVKDSADRLMSIAPRQGDAVGKIEIYRRVAYDFPDSKFAAEAQFMMGYTALVELKDRDQARKALERLGDRFGQSRWKKAGDYLLENIDVEDPTSLGTPREILHKAEG
jgi:peptidyl-prolyl cis-trans isomerase C